MDVLTDNYFHFIKNSQHKTEEYSEYLETWKMLTASDNENNIIKCIKKSAQKGNKSCKILIPKKATPDINTRSRSNYVEHLLHINCCISYAKYCGYITKNIKMEAQMHICDDFKRRMYIVCDWSDIV